MQKLIMKWQTRLDMKRINIVGDSFSSSNRKGDDYHPWFIQVGELLKATVDNKSMIGVSQDWCWWKLAQDLPNMTADDQILVVMTHPGRYWYFDDKPQMTNPNIVNIDSELSPEQLQAVQGYMMQIQRPPLDIQQMSHRLGWLQAQCDQYKLKPAQILCAFPLYVNSPYPMEEHINWETYSHVKISKGDLLTHVEQPEMKQGLTEYDLWKGWDCRYNHLMKSNHKILAQQVAQAIKNEEPIDLMTPNWHKGVLDLSVLDDSKFIEKELDANAITNRKTYLETEFKKPWAQRTGLFDHFKKKNI